MSITLSIFLGTSSIYTGLISFYSVIVSAANALGFGTAAVSSGRTQSIGKINMDQFLFFKNSFDIHSFGIVIIPHLFS